LRLAELPTTDAVNHLGYSASRSGMVRKMWRKLGIDELAMPDLTVPWPLSSESIELHVRLASIITLLPISRRLPAALGFCTFHYRRMVLEASTAPSNNVRWMHSLTRHLRLSFDRWRQITEARAKGFPGTSSRGGCGFIVSMVSSCFHMGDDAISDYDLFLHPGEPRCIIDVICLSLALVYASMHKTVPGGHRYLQLRFYLQIFVDE